MDHAGSEAAVRDHQPWCCPDAVAFRTGPATQRPEAVKSSDLRPDSVYRGRRMADLAGKGQSPVVPRGFGKCQEVDPVWPPARLLCAHVSP